jgi:hypothetical protein
VKQCIARQADRWIASSPRSSQWRQGTASRSRRMLFSRGIHLFPALSNEGAGNAGRPMRPIAACAHGSKKCTRVSRSHRNHPAFPTQWFTDYTCSPRCSGSLATVTPEKLSLLKNLTPASRCQDHTSSPSASSALVKSTIRVHRILPRVSDVGQRPSWWDRTERI